MSNALFALTLASALGCGVVAGVFFAFSTFVMRAFGRLPVPEGLVAMQQINIKAVNAWFMTALFGTAATSVAMVVAALLDWSTSVGPYLIAAAGLYLVGVIGVTIVCNVPRNNALAAIDRASADAATYWGRYLTEWTAWNHVRTSAPLVAMALEIGAIRAG